MTLERSEVWERDAVPNLILLELTLTRLHLGSSRWAMRALAARLATFSA